MKDRCRIYDMPGGAQLRVRGANPMSKQAIDALSTILKAAYAEMEKLPADLGERQSAAIARIRAKARRAPS